LLKLKKKKKKKKEIYSTLPRKITIQLSNVIYKKITETWGNSHDARLSKKVEYTITMYTIPADRPRLKGSM
jgi:hypothetical protein